MAFEELKQKQGVMWGSGPYQNVTDTITDIHEVVIERLAPQAGERWLDLACGTGAVAERAARSGAQVTGVDLAPALIDTARERAADQDLEIDYRVGDCERLDELGDGSFDIVSSTCGIMFAPDHAASAKELGRVTKSGGPHRSRQLGPRRRPRPDVRDDEAVPAAAPRRRGRSLRLGPPRARRGAARRRLRARVRATASPRTVPSSAEEYWQVFSTSYGPTKTLADSLDDDRREEFHQTWVDFFEQNYPDNGGIAHAREYLLVLGTRR